MVRVTLPTFIDFLIARASARVTKVRDARTQQESTTEYKMTDYYLPLRRALRDCLENNCDTSRLRLCVENLSDAKKVPTYTAIVKSLCAFVGRHDIEFRPVPKQSWQAAGLEVSVSPLGQLTIDGTDHIVFTYWKAAPLDQFRLQPTMHLLRKTHGQYGTPMVLEVRTGKTFTPGRRRVRGLDALLEGEAHAFVSMWTSDLDAA